jgi:hypothetical protein
MNLYEFLRRLEQADWPYFMTRVPYDDGTRVYAIGADEIWEVDFSDDGSFEAEVYRLADVNADPISNPAVLERAFGRLARAWKTAAADLEIRFVEPFQLTDETGAAVQCAGYLPDFGGSKGTVIISREDPDSACEMAIANGYYTSALNPRYYERYDRTHFIETLTDWGWFGKEPPPAWYKPVDE